MSDSKPRLIILSKTGPAIITKTNAYCLEILIPVRQQRSRSGLVTGEIGQHWERLSSNGCVVRCHTYLEALEAQSLCQPYIEEGQWLAARISGYDPSADDLPYYDWIKGVRGRKLNAYGFTEEDLPESQDPGLLKLSDDEWIRRGPR